MKSVLPVVSVADPKENPLHVADRVLAVIEKVTRTHAVVETAHTLGIVDPSTVSRPLTNLENCAREMGLGVRLGATRACGERP